MVKNMGKINEFKEEKKVRLNIWIFAVQIAFLALVFLLIYIFYPKVDYTVQGNVVKFSSLNSDLIVVSKNPDFSNPKYINFDESEEAFVKLEPGNYYWKPANSLINGFRKEIKINSEVGMRVKQLNENGDAELENIGNVKINVTRNKDGVLIGHIVLNPDESQKIDDSGEYIGRQND